MPFPFTFKLSSQISVNNPFVEGQQYAQFQATGANQDADPLNLAGFPHSASYSSTSTTASDWARSRKRSRTGERIGASQVSSRARPTTGLTFAQGSGYLDTPAKYRNQYNNMDAHKYTRREAEIDEEDDELIQEPPSKRRRGLAGSIVSTAMSAALIGTAVGLSVYRLWRDRGKESPYHEPPPPYSASSSDMHQHNARSHSRAASPPSPQYTVHPKKSQRKAVAPRRKKKTHQATPSTSSATYQPPPEFDFSVSMDTTEPGEFGESTVDDQISSLSSKLSTLIAEGQRALGREIVVAGDDSEEDPRDAWLDVDENGDRRSSSRSPKKKRRGSTSAARPTSISREPSYLNTTNISGNIPASASTPISISRVVDDDVTTWTGSPDLQEEMRKARERVMAQRGRVMA